MTRSEQSPDPYPPLEDSILEVRELKDNYIGDPPAIFCLTAAEIDDKIQDFDALIDDDAIEAAEKPRLIAEQEFMKKYLGIITDYTT